MRANEKSWFWSSQVWLVIENLPSGARGFCCSPVASIPPDTSEASRFAAFSHGTWQVDVTPVQHRYRGHSGGCPDRLLCPREEELDVERQSPPRGGAYKRLNADRSADAVLCVSRLVCPTWGRCRSKMRNLSAFP